MAAHPEAIAAQTHRDLLDEPRKRMATAQLKKVDEADEYRQRIGRGIVRMRQIAGLSQKETAALIGRDVAQLARWEAGTERPQFDRFIAVPQLQRALLLAFAEKAPGVAITTHIDIPRSA